MRLFTCEPNDGVFVNISSVKLIPPERPGRRDRRPGRVQKLLPDEVIVHKSRDGQPIQKWETVDFCDTPGEGSLDEGDDSLDELSLYPVSEVHIDDRVIWAGEDGYERATVKWVGTLPDGDGELLAGVEFVS